MVKMNNIYCRHCGHNIDVSDKEKQKAINIMIVLMIENKVIMNMDYDITSLFNACIECCDYPDYQTGYRINED